MTARADLHVHSKASNRPSEWILRQFGAPESFTEPKEVYRTCRERGMDFVTLSDHDTIDGALEIAHLPGVFLSEEVTVEFPEDGCELHCLVTGITEEQHRDIQRLRKNVYELRDYFREHDILHSIAHPLFRVNDRLTLPHLEKLIVLFNRFEALNGIHDRRANDLVQRIFGSLSREAIENLAERHRLEPLGPTPWVKTFTGGSDDHGGFYIATTYTRTPPAATVSDYLAHLRAGRHEPGGETGSSLRLVQSLYSIAHEYYRRQFPALLGNRKDPFAELLRSLAQGSAPGREAGKAGLRNRLAQVVRRHRGTETADRSDPSPLGPAARASQKSLTALLHGVFRQARRGRLAESVGALSHLAPLALSIAPYLVSLHAQHKDADLLEAASLRFLGQPPEGDRRGKRAWFTDRTAGRFDSQDGELVAVTCGRERPAADLAVRAFAPLLELPLPGHPSLKLTLPPLLEVLEHCERERYSEILVGTAGPLGLVGLAAGKLLGIRVTGLCRAGFPSHVRRLSGSPALEDLAWVYLRWFFTAMDTVVVVSRRDHETLVAQGFDPARLTLRPFPSARPERRLRHQAFGEPVLSGLQSPV